ncbi:MAG: GIY-YIG nuclease family protein [Acutalibacteraceae bacterium]|nr:GIY-YIG nuclease family protein [Acutalibacteraceae bacterium]
MYYIYMLRCKDNSIYTGITVNLEKRMNQHFTKSKQCAKYTLNHTPIKLEMVWTGENRSLASKLEYQIKQLTKIQKENLITLRDLEVYLSEKLTITDYSPMNIEDINRVQNNILHRQL